jgi:putative acetyltransferase
VPDLIVACEDPRTDDVRELLETHLAFARLVTPPGHVHALDLSGLLESNVSFFTARRSGELVGVGALKELDAVHGEIKSMHTTEVARGRGVGRAIADHLIGIGRARGYTRLSLETGTMVAFAPARALYESVGFQVCEPFGDYWANPNSVCMRLELSR